MKIKEGIDLLDYVESKEDGTKFLYGFDKDWHLFFQWERSDFEKLIELCKKYAKYSKGDDYCFKEERLQKYLAWVDENNGQLSPDSHHPYSAPRPNDMTQVGRHLTTKLWTKPLMEFRLSRKSTKISGYTQKQLKYFSGRLKKYDEINQECDIAVSSIRRCRCIYDMVIIPLLDVDDQHIALKRQKERCERAVKRSNAIYDLIDSGYELHQIPYDVLSVSEKANEVVG